MAARAPLLLIPGLICTARLWAAQQHDLADIAEIHSTDAHFRFDSVQEIAAAILAEAPQRFALAGLSMGGYVAFEVMRQAPERVERLALLNTSARSDDDARRAERRLLIEQVQHGRFLGVTDRLMPYLVHDDALQRPTVADTVKAMAQEIGREGYVRQQTAILNRPESCGTLRWIACPTLIVGGREDRLTPPAQQEEIHAAVAGSTLLILERCGHLSPLEHPQSVSDAMRTWLTR